MVKNVAEKKEAIFVDADACPVKEEISQIATEFKMAVVFVASYTHKMINPVYGKWVYVDPDREAVDLYILNHAKTGDIVITQDIGLASLSMPKGVYVITPKGKVYDSRSITIALQFRYLAAKERQQGKTGKGPNKFTKEDRDHFCRQFVKFLSKFAGN